MSVKAAAKAAAEAAAAAAASEELGEALCLACPPLEPVLKILRTVSDMANVAKENERAFAQLAMHLQHVQGHLEWVGEAEEDQQRRCVEPVVQVGVALQDARQLLERYSNRNWLQRWFSAKRFSEELIGISASLALSISVLSLERATKAVEGSPKKKSKADILSLVEGIAAREKLPADRDDIRARLKQAQLSRSNSDHTTLGKARAGDFRAVVELIRRKDGHPDEAGSTFALIHQAVFWEDVFAVAALINLGADVNATTGQECADLGIPASSTPLHIAVAIANDKVVRLLLCAGASTSLRDGNGKTTGDLETTESCKKALAMAKGLVATRELMGASARDRKLSDAVAMALENNIPFDTRLGRDFSLVHYAAMQGDLGTYKVVVAAGGSPHLRSAKDGLLPSEVARKFKRDAIVAVLRDKEGPPVQL